MTDQQTPEQHLAEILKRIEDVNPRCNWGNALEVDWPTQIARARYHELMAIASKLEAELGM